VKRQDGYLTRQSGAWLGHYSKWILDHRTGQRKRLQRAFKIGPASSMTKTEAREKLRRRIVEEVGITADSRVTLAWFIEHRWKPLHEGGWRESTKQTNEELLKVLTARFGTTTLEDVDLVPLQQWLNSIARVRSGSAVKHLRIFLRSIMQAAFEQDYVRKNPTRMLRVPKLRTVSKTYLTIEEVTSLLNTTLVPRDKALLRLMLVTALRPSELFALRWKNIDLKEGTMTISETVYRGVLRPYTKTTEDGEVQRLVVPPAALDALAEWYTESKRTADDDFIFPNADGGFILKENFQQRTLNDLAERAGIPKLNFQILRRTVATHAQDLGTPKDIATLMRHKQVQVSQQHYIQAIEASVKRTGERLADKLLANGKVTS
jgi:integrase